MDANKESIFIFPELEKYTPPALANSENCVQPLTNTTFLKVIERLAPVGREPSLKLTLQVVELNCITCNQIIRLMDLFNLEKDKLSIAKSAYTSCFDQENYFMVVRTLQFEPSKLALLDYIDNFGK